MGDRPKIQIEAIEDKVKFLVQVLGRLRQMYVDGVRERIDEIQEKVGVKESDLEYPTLTMQSVGTPKVITTENEVTPEESGLKNEEQ